MIVLKMGEQKLMDQCLQLVENKIYRAVISKPSVYVNRKFGQPLIEN